MDELPRKPTGKRVAALWGCGLYGALFLATLLVGALTRPKPEAVANALYLLTLPTILAGIGLSYLARRWRRLAVAIGAVWVASPPGVIIWGWTGRRLRPDDRVAFEMIGGRAVHPTLGISFPALPEGFAEAQVPEETKLDSATMHKWYFVNEIVEDAVIVIAGRERGGVSAEWFSEMTRGIRDKARRTGGIVLLDSLSTSPVLSYALKIRLVNGSHAEFVCRASGRGSSAGVVACIETVGRGTDALERVRNGLSVPK